MKDKIFEYLTKKGRILILGFGKEGKSTYEFIRSMDATLPIGIADMKDIADEKILFDTNVFLHIGENYLDACSQYDVIIKGPGVIIKDYLPAEIQKRITCQTDLFVHFCEAKTIGITGTKGKSTTTSLMYHILKSLGKKAILMGNIGIPVFDTIDEIEEDTICVMELGCHQLEFMRYSPNIAVLLNIYEEHLDHYLSMDHYIDSKKNIYRHQGREDVVLLGNSAYLKDNDTMSIIVRNDASSPNYYELSDEELVISYQSNTIHIPKSKIDTNLKGEHNLSNILVCLTIGVILDLDIDECIKAISSFKGLPHRMELVGTYQDITYYDDSIATSIPSVIYAVQSLEKVDTIIVGGMDRGLDYHDLVDFLYDSNVHNILLLPDTNKRIQSLFDELGNNKNVISVKDMVEAVETAKKVTEKGKICLLSPAAASYGFYKNFEERGDHFQSLVKENNS